MDIDELRTVQTKERQKDSLQHLRDSFYEDVAAYIQELKARRTEAADAVDDPFSDPEISQLTDEIETAEDVVEAVYERRVGKVVKLASFAAADMPVDEEGLTLQERDLFEDLVGRIGENKGRVLDILAGEGDTGPATGSAPTGGEPSPEPTEETPAHRGPEHVAGGPGAETTTSGESSTAPSATDETPSRGEPAVETNEPAGATAESDGDDVPPAPPEEAPPEETVPEEPLPEGSAETEPAAPDERPPAGEKSRSRPDGGVTAAAEQRTTVRITADVGQLLGMDDREYDLRTEDVVSLPEANADALLQREAAEEL